MIYEYKLACIEAGLSEEQIREIPQVFDTEYKRNDYDEKKRRKYGMTGSAVRWKKEQLLKKLKKRFFDQQ